MMLLKTKLLMPVVFGDCAYGRITALHGTSLGDCNSIVDFTTPHGTTVKTGIIYLSEPTEHELESLSVFEKDAINKGKLAYEIPEEQVTGAEASQ